jgi:hypothetical protein
MLGNQQIFQDSVKKYVSKYIIFPAGFVSQEVLNRDPTVWLDRARLPQRYICKYIKIKIPEFHMNNL